MKRTLACYITLFALLYNNAALAALPDVSNINKNSISDLYSVFTKYPNRLTGSAGCAFAEKFIEEKFRAAGLKNLTIDTIPIARPESKGCSLFVADKVFAVYAFWPNMSRTCTVPPEGLKGRIFYVGKGDWENYNEQSMDGAIVLMDIDSRENLYKARILGASAVIFIGSKQATWADGINKIAAAPFNYPRFWINEKDADEIKVLIDKNKNAGNDSAAVIKARVDFEQTQAKGIYGWLPGSDEKWSKQTVLLAAGIDANGYVPELSCGAEQASSIVALLEILDFFTKNPPKLSIIFLAYSGDTEAKLGILDFMARHCHVESEMNPEDEIAAMALPNVPGGNRMARIELKRTKGWSDAERKFKLLLEQRNQDYRKQHANWPTIAESRLKEAKYLSYIFFDLFVGLDITSHNYQVGMFYNSYTLNPGNSEGGGYGGVEPVRDTRFRPVYSDFGKKLEEYAGEIHAAIGVKNQQVLLNCVAPLGAKPWRAFMPVPVWASSCIAQTAGQKGVTMITSCDERRFVGTPNDVLENVDIDNVVTQVKALTLLFHKCFNDTSFIPQRSGNVVLRKVAKGMTRMRRINVLYVEANEFDPARSKMPDVKLPGALMFVQNIYPENITPGVYPYQRRITDGNGRCKIIIPELTAGPIFVDVYGYVLDKNTGEITYALDRAQSAGPESNYPALALPRQIEGIMPILFKCKSTEFYDNVDPKYLIDMVNIDLTDAYDAPLTSYGFDIAPHGAVIYTRAQKEGVTPERLKIFLSGSFKSAEGGKSGLGGSLKSDMRFILINASDDQPLGSGYSSAQNAILRTSEKVLRDMNILDTYRIERMRALGIEDPKIDKYHLMGKRELEAAARAYDNRSYDQYIKHIRDGLGYEVNSYPEIKATANDTVRGIVFYFALLLPFAIFAERLIFGFADMRKQIAGFFGIFCLVFFILRYIHPAFQISVSPYIIFLAFIILALGVLVSGLVLAKFSNFVRKLRKKASRDHEIDVNRASAIVAAFNLGISNLKKRKVRTGLTVATIILLTFSILSFTSIRSTTTIFKMSRTNRPSYPGVLIRNVDWRPLSQYLLEYVKTTFDAMGAKVTFRYWFIPTKPDENYNIELLNKESPSGASVICLGLVGAAANEPEISRIDKCLLAGRWLKEDELNAVVLPNSMAKRLQLDFVDMERNRILFFGREFKVVGIFDEKLLNRFKDLDNEGITPAIFPTAKQTEEAIQGRTTEVKNISAFDHADAYNIAFCHPIFVQSLGGKLRSIAVRFPAEHFGKTVEEFLKRVGVTVFVGERERVEVFSSFDTTSVAGMGNLIILILIAALIILNTMLGSVYERFREIGTYSSVGLAPVHIASLFIAEACVYAVIGAVVGYLLGQVVSTAIVKFGVFKELSLNYSSFAAIFATMIVMITVLASTIYPARKASQLSVPDVTRHWKLPDPQGDVWAFDFPFTVPGIEVLGLKVFLRNFFDSYTEASVGNFYAANIELKSEPHPEGTAYNLGMNIWLSPFDLGVTQYVEFKSVPTGQHNIYLIKISIIRKGGDADSWKRLNEGFIKQLRKQFLIWRTVPVDTKVKYTGEGENLISGQKTAPSGVPA